MRERRWRCGAGGVLADEWRVGPPEGQPHCCLTIRPRMRLLAFRQLRATYSRQFYILRYGTGVMNTEVTTVEMTAAAVTAVVRPPIARMGKKGLMLSH